LPAVWSVIEDSSRIPTRLHPRSDAPPALAALGVGCVTCHVTDGGALPVTLSARRSGGAAPHPVLRDAELATARACAGCHEFAFPIRAPQDRPELMQSTVSEHARSGYPDVPCAGCHMPATAGPGSHRSHRFDLGPDGAMLREAVVARARRVAPSRIAVTLTPGRVGHAFPTGDLFRRLVVTAEVVGEDWLVLGADSRSLRRRFELRDAGYGQTVRRLLEDDRVGAGPPEPITLDVGEGGRGRPIAWRVEYQRVEHPLGHDETSAVVADSVIVAEGVAPGAVEERP
jgi:hypothetical protein